MNKTRKRIHPTLCITHRCNLDCIYCYQNHDSNDMSFDTAKKCIDNIFENIPNEYDDIEISFIGGEPLLKFELIKSVVEYTNQKYADYNYFFFASTNGTVLTEEMKEWFSTYKDIFTLGLSFDGIKKVQDYNRSNSFDDIDVSFFNNN